MTPGARPRGLPIGVDHKPNCLVQIWATIAQGAPADNAVATMSYYAFEGEPSWHVQVGDQYSGVFEDSCSQTRR